MAKYGPDVAAILVTTVSATTTFQDISGYVQQISGLDIEALLERTDGFGDAWEEHSYIGKRKAAPITLTAFYDDAAATGPHAIFGALATLGTERVLKLKFGTTNEYPKVDVMVQKYTRLPNRDGLTGTQIVLQPTGAVTLGAT